MNRMRLIFMAVLAGWWSSPASGDFARFETFLERDALFETTPESWFEDPRDQAFFRWLSPAKDEARYPGYSNSPQMTFLGKTCWETKVRFVNGKLAEVSISLYNRGDSGDVAEEKTFQAMCDAVGAEVEKWAGEKGVVQPVTRLGNGMRVQQKAWVRNKMLAIELKWSASENIRTVDPRNPGAVTKVKFRAEYILLTLSKFDPRNDPRRTGGIAAGRSPESASARDIKANVVRDADGSVCIANIPMVDQGQKGYCAVATSERLLRYYGLDFDQNTLAQIANTSASQGTNPDQLIDTLKKLGVKCGVRVRVHNAFDLQEFMAFVTDYNRAAKRAKKSQITLGRIIDINEVYGAMDMDLLKKARCERERAEFRGFCTNIVKHVDLGIPLAWSVVLGKIPEVPALPQAGGGHMRVIQGYNKARTAIFYSDSWGSGHEKKTMPMDDAWAITTGLYSFDPSR